MFLQTTEDEDKIVMKQLPSEIYHYSSEPIEFLDDTKWILTEDGGDSVDLREVYYNPGKPNGFWLSIEDDGIDEGWAVWCKEQDFCLEGLKYRYRVNLKKGSKILLISSYEELLDFSIKNAKNDPLCLEHSMKKVRDQFPKLFKSKPKEYIYSIEWRPIIENYDGIIIAPYQRIMDFNMTLSWYYGWDCASGCIWNTDQIELELDPHWDYEGFIKS